MKLSRAGQISSNSELRNLRAMRNQPTKEGHDGWRCVYPTLTWKISGAFLQLALPSQILRCFSIDAGRYSSVDYLIPLSACMESMDLVRVEGLTSNVVFGVSSHLHYVLVGWLPSAMANYEEVRKSEAIVLHKAVRE